MISSVQISIDAIKDEARSLVSKGVVGRQQPIYVLCRFFPACEWNCIECELERNDFLLRDRIIDLLGREDWQED
jgi:hypothetical protein